MHTRTRPPYWIVWHCCCASSATQGREGCTAYIHSTTSPPFLRKAHTHQRQNERYLRTLDRDTIKTKPSPSHHQTKTQRLGRLGRAKKSSTRFRCRFRWNILWAICFTKHVHLRVCRSDGRRHFERKIAHNTARLFACGALDWLDRVADLSKTCNVASNGRVRVILPPQKCQFIYLIASAL